MTSLFCSKGKVPLIILTFLSFFSSYGQITTCPTDNVPPVEDAVINGDFEIGVIGRNTFVSDHEWAGDKIKQNLDQKICNEGTVGHFFIGKEEEYYCGLRDRRGTTFHQNFGTPFNSFMKSLPDHTFGKGGIMLQVDSDPNHAIAWQQEVKIFPQQEYFFSCWLANMIQSAGDAQIAFYVKGNQEPAGNSPTDPCYRLDATCQDGATKPGFSAAGVMNWEQYTATWDSKNHTGAIITIFNQSKTVEGNDYALDDISFINNCGKSTPPIPALGPNLSICETDGLLELNTKIGQEPGRTFFWYDVTNGKFLEKGEDLDKYIVEEPGRYMVCVEDNSPCPKIDHIDIIDTIGVEIDDVLLCEGNEVEIKSGIEKNAHLKFEWIGPSLNMGDGPNTMVNKNGKHTFKVSSSKYPNCNAEDDFNVDEVNPEAELVVTDTLCPGQDVTIKGTGPDADEYTYWDQAVGGTEYLPGGKEITLQFDEFPVTVYVENSYGCRIPIEIEENCPCDNPTPTVEDITICVGNDIKLNAEVDSNDDPRFFWFGPNGFESTEKNPTIPNSTLDMAGTYSVYIKTATCNFPSDTVELEVKILESEKVTPAEITINGIKLNEGDTVDICISDPIEIFGATPKADEKGKWKVTDENILTINPDDNANPDITLLSKGITKIEWTIDKEGDGLCPIIPTLRTVFVNVLGLPGELEEIIGPDSVCENSEITFSVPPVDGATFYEWYLLPPNAVGNSTSETITIKFGETSGKIGVRSGNVCGVDSLEIDVEVIIAPKVEVEDEANICAEESYTIQRSSIENTEKFEWELVAGVEANLINTETLNPTYNSSIDEGGSTVVLVLKALPTDPCTSDVTDTFRLFISEIPEYSVLNDTVCQNESARLEVLPLKDYPNVVYNWYDQEVGGTLLNTGKVYEIENLIANFETWVAADGSCDVPRVKAMVHVNPLPDANFYSTTKEITEKGESIELIDLSVNGIDGKWVFGDGSDEKYVKGINPKHTFNPITGEVPDYYNITLYLISEYGCKDTAQLSIPVDLKWAIFIPNAFTPNGDGTNDYFSPVGYGIEEYEIRIFNRWGEMLFYSDDLNNHWKGLDKKKEFKSDTYVYKINVLNVYGKKFKYLGHINLLK